MHGVQKHWAGEAPLEDTEPERAGGGDRGDRVWREALAVSLTTGVSPTDSR
jgi:hypothetical protein